MCVCVCIVEMYSVVYNALWNPIEDARLLKLDLQTAIDCPI